MSEKTINLIVRIGGGAILFVALLLTFVINPHVNSDQFTNETMWEAVHPFKWWDIFGVFGLIGYALYVCGMLGKVVYSFTQPKSPNSSGLVHLVFVVCLVAIVTMYL